MLGDLAQLLVAQVLHSLPEVQDGVSYRLKGSFWIDHHRGQVPRLQGSAHGLACLKENMAVSLTFRGNVYRPSCRMMKIIHSKVNKTQTHVQEMSSGTNIRSHAKSGLGDILISIL